MQHLTALAPSLGLGGAERSLVRLVNALAQHDWSIDLIVFASGSNVLLSELRPGIRHHVIGRHRSSDPRHWMIVRRLVRRLNPDVVLGWSTYANLVACISRWPGDRWRLILSDRNYMPEIFHTKRLTRTRRWATLCTVKLLYRRADIITANSIENCRYLKRFIGGKPIYRHLPNIADLAGIHMPKLQPMDLPQKHKGPKLLAMGRLEHQKGFDIALKAMQRLRKVKPWSLVIVGEGRQRDHLQTLSTRLGLDSVVHWLGARLDPRPYYRWADIVIVPSRFEGFPNVALEAMACGCAVICADCMTGPVELTAQGRYGVLVPPENPDALAQAILAIGDDPKRCRSLGKAAAQYIADTYHADAVWPAIQNVFAVHPGAM